MLTRLADSWWLRFLASRLAQGVLVVFGAITIAFFLVTLSGELPNVAGSSFLQTPEQIAEVRHELGLDGPLLERYVDMVGNAVRGDFGRQYATGESAMALVLQSLPNTALLVGCAILIGWPLALAISTFSVLRRDSLSDRIVRRGLIVSQGVPEFWAGLLLVLLFSVTLHWLPSFGFTEGWRSVVMPATALSITLTPALVRLVRGQLLDFMAMDLATALRSRGISEARIVVVHALPNVLVPTIHFLTLQIGALLGGTLIVESVFGWPGIGQLLLTSAQSRELAVVEAIVVVIAVAYVVLSLVADLLSFAIDPRIRRAAA